MVVWCILDDATFTNWKWSYRVICLSSKTQPEDCWKCQGFNFEAASLFSASAALASASSSCCWAFLVCLSHYISPLFMFSLSWCISRSLLQNQSTILISSFKSTFINIAVVFQLCQYYCCCHESFNKSVYSTDSMIEHQWF